MVISINSWHLSLNICFPAQDTSIEDVWANKWLSSCPMFVFFPLFVCMFGSDIFFFKFSFIYFLYSSLVSRRVWHGRNYFIYHDFLVRFTIFFYYFVLAKEDLSQYLHNAFKVFYPIGSLGTIFFFIFLTLFLLFI